MNDRKHHKWKVTLATPDGQSIVETVATYWDPKPEDASARIAHAFAATCRAKGAEGVVPVSAELIGGSK